MGGLVGLIQPLLYNFGFETVAVIFGGPLRAHKFGILIAGAVAPRSNQRSVEVFMKRVLSRILIISGVALGCSMF
ncbi:hypothetical protein Q5O12_26545, partial [Klebsiella pneumoniae]|uniref:hypothetical protein n=1 Tax=Klebsiella pneumoniae TaxID=573 RepID=UPI0027321949